MCRFLGFLIITSALLITACQNASTPQAQQSKTKNKPKSKALALVSNEDFGDYRVEVKSNDELTTVEVIFRKLPTSSEGAAKIVRKALEKAVAKDSSREILAMAFDNDDITLPDKKYGGPLAYSPKEGRIMTMAERDGLKSTNKDEGAYFVKIEEGKTLAGIKPERKWLTCAVVFPKAPSPGEFKSAALVQTLVQIDKLRVRKLDVTVSAYSGDKNNPATWLQAKSANGKYLFLEYKKESGAITASWESRT